MFCIKTSRNYTKRPGCLQWFDEKCPPQMQVFGHLVSGWWSRLGSAAFRRFWRKYIAEGRCWEFTPPCSSTPSLLYVCAWKSALSASCLGHLLLCVPVIMDSFPGTIKAKINFHKSLLVMSFYQSNKK